MQISTNLFSLNAQRSLDRTSNDLTRSLSRLSSGLRINSAADDAAGLAVGSRMTAQLRGMNRAERNANDSVSLLQTAEGAMGTVVEALQRARELAVQAANATNNSNDRAALQAEVSQLMAEIDRVGRATTFNGTQVFAQETQGIAGDTNVRAVLDGLKLGWLEEAESRISRFFGIQGDGAELRIQLTAFTDSAGGAAARVVGAFTSAGPGVKGTDLRLQVDMADFTPPNLPSGGNAPFYNDRIIAHEMVHAVMYRAMDNFQALPTWFTEGVAEFVHGADERLAADVQAAGGIGALLTAAPLGSWASTSAHYSTGYLATRYLHDALKDAGASGGLKAFMQALSQPGATMDATFSQFFAASGGPTSLAAFEADFAANGAAFFNAGIDLANADTGAIGGLDADRGPAFTAESVIDNISGTAYGDNTLKGFRLRYDESNPTGTSTRNLSFHVGTQSALQEGGQTIDSRVGAVNVQALGLGEVDVAKDARRAIVHIDEALTFLNSQRGEIGAQLSRMDGVIANLRSGSVNLAASRSRIMDADFAQESARQVRAQILQQAAVSMLAQANAIPQLALSLLR
ncbi:MAG: flagellinolysin [Burkholderiales bacterium]|nr:flagellinolysin [Burkholderiales bacterium]